MEIDFTGCANDPDRGCVRSTSRSGTARPRELQLFGDFGHPNLLRLVFDTAAIRWWFQAAAYGLNQDTLRSLQNA